jgi:hypothetical protein
MSSRETPEFVDNDEDLNETAAADTLKPGAGSGGTSKAEMLSTFTSMLAALGKEDLSKFFNDSIALIGKEADKIPSSAAASNKASVNMKEDIDEMFSDDELSEEFKERAATIFEAVVNSQVILETARLEEEFEEAVLALEEEFAENMQTQVNDMFEELTTKLDQYLDYVVESWMEENELAIENSLRSEIAEDFIGGLHKLFSEHYITVPESQVDLVAEMRAELADAKAKLDEAIDDKLALESVIAEATAEAMFDEVSEGLVETQVEKLRSLAEGIDYADAATYRKKLETLKESAFSKKTAPASSTGLITEEIDGEDTSHNPTGMAPNMSAYVASIAKSVK